MHIKAGQIWRHYKGILVVVVGLSEHTETGETMVIYHHYGEYSKWWTRPLKMWDEAVMPIYDALGRETEKESYKLNYSNGSIVRFLLVQPVFDKTCNADGDPCSNPHCDSCERK